MEDDKYKFKINGFKQDYAISQLIAPFESSDIFAFEINRYGHCYNCKLEDHLHEFLGPIIQLNSDDLDLSIKEAIEKRFENLALICKNCGWFKDRIISKYATYSLTIKDIKTPDIMFLFYDVGEHYDNFNSVINNIRHNLVKIINQLEYNIKIRNDVYNLSGIICCPYNGHYTCIIINLNENFYCLKKGLNYFYDDMNYNHCLIEITNFKDILKDNLPYIAI